MLALFAALASVSASTRQACSIEKGYASCALFVLCSKPETNRARVVYLLINKNGFFGCVFDRSRTSPNDDN